MIAIIDYGVGNLHSLASSLSFLGLDNIITNKKEDLKKADKIILPGVGAFKDAIEKLHATGLVEVLKQEVENGKPMLGICLGMQLLFEQSLEYGCHKGLGFLQGTVSPLVTDITDATLKIPHIGWNALDITVQDDIFKYIKNGDYVYYVHSFYAKNCTQNTLATSDYSIAVTGVVRKGNIYGMQFHPEKSGDVGLALLRAFAEI